MAIPDGPEGLVAEVEVHPFSKDDCSKEKRLGLVELPLLGPGTYCCHYQTMLNLLGKNL